MRQKRLLTAILSIVFVLLSGTAHAYPTITHEDGTNITLNKQLVYSLPEKYFNGVDEITFTNEPIKHNGKLYTGWYSVNWYGDYFFNARIWVFGKKIINYTEGDMNKTLKHELCHHKSYYKLHDKVYSDEYAEDCRVKESWS